MLSIAAAVAASNMATIVITIVVQDLGRSDVDDRMTKAVLYTLDFC